SRSGVTRAGLYNRGLVLECGDPERSRSETRETPSWSNTDESNENPRHRPGGSRLRSRGRPRPWRGYPEVVEQPRLRTANLLHERGKTRRLAQAISGSHLPSVPEARHRARGLLDSPGREGRQGRQTRLPDRVPEPRGGQGILAGVPGRPRVAESLRGKPQG